MTRAAVVVTTVLLLLVSATPILFSLNDDSSITVDGADDNIVKINSLEDLLAIGNDTGSLGKDYVQTANIDFEDGDYNGGFNIDTKVTIVNTGTEYEITISLHYSDTGETTTILTTENYALISLNGTVKTMTSGEMEAKFTLDKLPNTLEISAGGIASDIPNDAWTDEEDTLDTGDPSFAIACSLTGISGTTEGPLEYTSNSNGNFTPIGSSSDPFTGTYDGSGFTINNLNIAVFSDSYAYSGMFGYIESDNVVLKGIGLTNNSSIAVTSFLSDETCAYSGGLAGHVNAQGNGTVTIQNCYTTGNVIATASSGSHANVDLGGLVGYVDAPMAETVIQGCYTTGNVIATASSESSAAHYLDAVSGGLVGSFNGSNGKATIQNCYTTGNITAIADSPTTPSRLNVSAYSGGIIGNSITSDTESMTIEDCHTTGNITATVSLRSASLNNIEAYSGGLVGTLSALGCKTTIQGCYTTGNIKTTASSSDSIKTYSGGLVGSVDVDDKSLVIQDCYTKGDVITIVESAYSDDNSGVYTYSGGLAGYVRVVLSGSSLTIKNCHTTGNLTATVTSIASVEMYTGGLAGYVIGDVNTSIIQDCYTTGNITATANAAGKSSGYSVEMEIGGLMGHIRTIEGIIVVKNCHTAGIFEANGGSTSDCATVVIGGLTGGIEDCIKLTIQDCYTTGDLIATAISLSDCAITVSGGLAGSIYTSHEEDASDQTTVIERCYTTGNINAHSTSESLDEYADANSGGLVGNVTSSSTTTKIDSCYTTGVITATALAAEGGEAYANSGGLAGTLRADRGPMMVLNCYTVGQVSASALAAQPDSNYTGAYSGGLTGLYRSDFNAHPLSIQNCYSTAMLAANATEAVTNNYAIGGTVGFLRGTVYIYNCYYLSEEEINKELNIYGGKGDSATVYIDGNESIGGTSERTDEPSGGRTLAQLRSEDTYYDGETVVPGSEPEINVSGWIFYDPSKPDDEHTWFIDTYLNNGLPVLMNIKYGITSHPKDVISDKISDNTFSVTSPIGGTYQWYYSTDDASTPDEEKTWTLISGATSYEYKTSDNGIDNFYNFYRCVITTILDQTLTSNSAQLLIDWNVTVNITGDGTVSFNDQEIDVSPYMIPFDQITNPMEFIITPSEYKSIGSIIFNGTDIKDEEGNGIDNRYKITPAAGENTLNITFVETEYNISVSDDIMNGNISLKDNITSITNSETCEITITPDTGYVFEKIWIVQDQGKEESAPKTAILTKVNDTKYKLSSVTGNCTINASFILANYTIDISDQIANGSILSSKSLMTYEDVATITITPGENYILDKIWIVEDADKEEGVPKTATLTKVNDTEYKLSNVTGDCTITATFKVTTAPDEEPVDGDGDGDSGLDPIVIAAVCIVAAVVAVGAILVIRAKRP